MRRRRSTPEQGSSAHDTLHADSVDRRLTGVEGRLEEMARAIDTQVKRLTALEAQLDYLASKVRPV